LARCCSARGAHRRDRRERRRGPTVRVAPRRRGAAGLACLRRPGASANVGRDRSWNGVVGGTALVAAITSGSSALVAFALSTLVDSSASAALIWRSKRNGATRRQPSTENAARPGSWSRCSRVQAMWGHRPFEHWSARLVVSRALCRAADRGRTRVGGDSRLGSSPLRVERRASVLELRRRRSYTRWRCVSLKPVGYFSPYPMARSTPMCMSQIRPS
jgi:hypothetical protein